MRRVGHRSRGCWSCRHWKCWTAETGQEAGSLLERAAAGISRSEVSRETIEAAEAEQKKLLERLLKELDLLIIYMDGICFAEHHVIAAVGVDAEGNKRCSSLVASCFGETRGSNSQRAGRNWSSSM